ncbi:ATP-binding protein [Streptomyces gobiensis]|uniref:ATP-binding protein n=1 Tax=Streptomyces gobiensis TaxID=2875706 RepID=UPI001E5FDB5C|nr:AAA family ATPase [Streptomyces gobiensis]UGY94654.1 AAA family ATPase [Streptomyces gobiensis]
MRTLERETELRAAHAALDRLCSRSAIGAAGVRQGGLLVFTGPPGAGKSTLLAEVRRLAAERDCAIMSARGGEQEQATAFHVVRQLLQPLLASYSERERHDVLGDWYRIVGPCVGLCPAEDGAAPDPQGVQDGLDWVVTNVAVRRGPLVLLIDDAQWVDPESLRWLSSFAARTEEIPALFVVTYRPDELPDEARVFRDGTGGSRLRPLDLAPLTPAAVSDLLSEALDAAVDDDFSHAAWLATDGNPFQTVELAAKVRSRGLAPSRANASQLRDMAGPANGIGLVERLDELGSSAVRLAWAVAVLGAEASLNLAASMAALGQLEAAQARERLRDARILKQDEALEFIHPLIATAVYREVPAAVRVGLHGKAAWELIRSGHGPTPAARHLLETHPEGDDSVVTTLRAAAREYLRAGAPDAARRCLERALREPPSMEQRAMVLYELGNPGLMYNPAATVNHLREALDEGCPDDELRQGTAIRLARALAYCDRLSEAVEVVEHEAHRATDSRVRLRMYAEHFKVAVFTSDDQDAPARSRRLARLTERLTGRDETERRILGLRAWDAVVRGEPAATALEYAERAMSSGDMSWTDEDWGFEVPTLLGLTFLYCDQPDRADELFTRGVAEFEGQGWHGVPLALGYTFLGYIRFRSGRLSEAEDFMRAGLRLADRVGPGASGHWNAAGSLIEVLLARGKVSAAERLARDHGFGKPFPSAVTIPNAQMVYGELLLAKGMPKEAAEELAEVGRGLDARGMHNPSWCPWLLQLALASHAMDDGKRAQELGQEALRRAERFGTDSAVGQALWVAGRLSDGAERADLLRRAVSHLERSPAVYELSSALVDLGSVLRCSGQLREAAECLYRGVDIAVQCGAEAVVAQARGELVAAGLRPRRLGTGR